MYDDLIAALRDMSKMGMKYGMAVVKMQEAADAIDELSRRCEQFQYMPPPAWIPVTERLPEQEKQVLVTGIEAIGNAQIYGVKQLDGDVWRPTSAPSCYWKHWMPLPQPPKEET